MTEIDWAMRARERLPPHPLDKKYYKKLKDGKEKEDQKNKIQSYIKSFESVPESTSKSVKFIYSRWH